MKTDTVMYPQISQVGPQARTESAATKGESKAKAVPGEFEKVYAKEVDKKAESSQSSKTNGKDLSEVKQSLKFSSHAAQRLKDRKIQLDPSMMAKVSNAVDLAETKGLEDTLVLTPNAALIVNVPNRTVITALDKGSYQGNVFTNIDGAVVVNG